MTRTDPGTAHPPRPMRADARRNYERIVATAYQVFAESGVDAPLDEIARRAKVGAGTLYRHFPNREALMEAVYRGEMERLSERAHELLAERPPDEALAEWMREQVRWVLHGRGMVITLKAALDRDSVVFTYCKSKMTAAVGDIVAAAKAAGTVREDIEPGDLLRLGHGIAAATESAPQDAERLLSVLLDGLRPR